MKKKINKRSSTNRKWDVASLLPIAVEAIESFIRQNSEPRYKFKWGIISNGVDAAETDKAMLIEGPRNL